MISHRTSASSTVMTDRFHIGSVAHDLALPGATVLKAIGKVGMGTCKKLLLVLPISAVLAFSCKGALAEAPPLLDLCGQEHATANAISDHLQNQGWQHHTLSDLPNFGPLNGDYTVLQAFLGEDIPAGNAAFQEGRIRLIQQNLQMSIALGLHEKANREEYGQHHLHSADYSQWVVVVSWEPRGVECIWYSRTQMNDSQRETSPLIPEDHPVMDILDVLWFSETEIENGHVVSQFYVVDPEGFTNLTGITPELAEVLRVRRVDDIEE